MTWQDALAYLKIWGEWIKEEIDAPDRWADLTMTARLIPQFSDEPDEVFDPGEIRQLKNQMRALETRFEEIKQLPAADRKQLVETVQQTAPKAATFTKKDFWNVFIGAVLRKVTELGMSQDNVNLVLQAIKSTFNGLFLG